LQQGRRYRESEACDGKRRGPSRSLGDNGVSKPKPRFRCGAGQAAEPGRGRELGSLVERQEKQTGPEVSGRPTNQPPIDSPQRRLARLAVRISTGVTVSFKTSVCIVRTR